MYKKIKIFIDVRNLILIPKFFCPRNNREKKASLICCKACRLGGGSILYFEIPQQGKIDIIRKGEIKSVDEIVNNYDSIKKLRIQDMNSRSWLCDVLACVNEIETKEFSLKDMYLYIEILQEKHKNNHNVEAKIRQQLQILRDKGFIEFLGRGHYRKRF